MKKLFSEVAEYLAQKRRRKIWMRVVSALACIVVFCTTYSLILPAITLENTDTPPDPTADVETAEVWEATLPEELSGVWSDDLVAVAESQLDYAESTANYILAADETVNGYTRYGAWYSGAYGEEGEDYTYVDWNSLFALFCLNYAGVTPDAMPQQADIPAWVEALTAAEYYIDAEGYTPQAGNLAFFDTDADGSADRVGIVAEYSEAGLLSGAEIRTIEGDAENQVQYMTYDPADETILGYAVVPENPEAQISATALDEDDTVDDTDVSDDSENGIAPQADEGIAPQALTDGTFAIVDQTSQMAMLPATNSNGSGNQATYYMQAREVMKLDTSGDDPTVKVSTGTKIDVWTLESAGNNTYYISTTANGSTQYLYVTTNNNRYSLQLGTNRTAFTVTENTDGTISLTYVVTNNRGQITTYYLTYNDTYGFGVTNRSNSSNVSLYFVDSSNVTVDEGIVAGLTPAGTVVNLFDYWTTDRWPDGGDYSEGNTINDSGINAGHALKFTTGSSTYNSWTGSAQTYPDIVQNTLINGYPSLNGTTTGSTESLNYLFDPDDTTVEGRYRQTFSNAGGLLQLDDEGYYYYDSKKNFAEFNEGTSQFTLYNDWGVQTRAPANSSDGQFFPFNAYADVARVYTNDAKLNHYFGLTLTTRFAQKHGGHTDASDDAKATTYEFSGDDDVWIFIDDVLVADLGGMHDAASVKIDFSTGQVVINEGTAYQSTTSLYQQFQNAGKASSVTWNDDNTTFADDTYHVLKFYYLERGNSDSNLTLKYNLTTYPATGIYKVDQYGDPVPGATFAVYAADNSYNYLNNVGGQTVTLPASYAYDEAGNIVDGNGTTLVKQLYTGKTDASGRMVFVDKDNMPYTLTELESMFGSYFILKETAVPEGYRLVSDEIRLKIVNHKILLCDNSYESGVWSAANLLVTAPNTIKLADSGTGGKTPPAGSGTATDGSGRSTIDYYDAEGNVTGTVFAVVLKYSGNGEAGLTDQSNWSPVYGTAEEGFTVVDINSPDTYADDNNPSPFTANDFISAAIWTAQQYVESDNVFSLSSGGQMQGGLEGMPGSLENYYYMGAGADTQYTVAYYWTSEDSLDTATSGNTWRIDSDDAAGTPYAFERTFGATISVPNLVNRLFVQKFDEDDTLVNGATFAIYKVNEVDDKIYYVADDGTTDIYLEPDTDGDNTGKATVNGTEYTYKVDSSNGTITVGENQYTITPKPYVDGATAGQTQYSQLAQENGTVTFSNLLKGTYYVREINAPEGYTLNSTEIMVLVDDEAVYANAGTADDGVTVARGPGYVVSTLSQFASEGDIDNTLTWIYMMLKVGQHNTFSDFTTALNDISSWDYATDRDGGSTKEQSEAMRTYLTYDPDGGNALFNYQADSSTAQVSEGATVNIQETRRLYTDVGWSYVEIFQNYRYGSANHKEGANYTNLHGEGQYNTDISNLFSRSTYIQVTDEKVSNLEISKTVANSTLSEGATDDTSFAFKVDLYTVSTEDENGKETTANIPLTGTYNYTVYDVDANGDRTVAQDSDNNDITGTITTGTATISLKHNQVVVIEDLPADAHYTVTETSNPDYTTTYVVNNGESVTGLAASGTLAWKTATDDTDDTKDTITVAFTNTYVPKINITIKKIASGESTPLSGAQFVLYKVEDEHTYYYNNDNGTWEELADDKQESDYALTTASASDEVNAPAEGTITFSNISGGTYYLKEIKAPDGYNLLGEAITIRVSEGKIQNAVGNSTTYEFDGATITVPNSAGYELPSTGGPGTYIYTFSGLLLMAGALMYVYIMRRKKERRAEK